MNTLGFYADLILNRFRIARELEKLTQEQERNEQDESPGERVAREDRDGEAVNEGLNKRPANGQGGLS